MDSDDEILVSISKCCAVARLIGFCEGLIDGGVLAKEISAELQLHLDQTLSVFGMPPPTLSILDKPSSRRSETADRIAWERDHDHDYRKHWSE